MDIKKIDEIKQFFAALIPEMELNAVYADAIYYHDFSREIAADKTAKEISSSEDAGIRLRAYDGEQFYEVALTGFDKEKITEAAKNLTKNIKKKNTFPLAIDTQKINKHFEAVGEIKPETISLQDKITATTTLVETILKKEKKLINCRSRYEEAKELRIFVNKYKQLSQLISSCLFVLAPYIKTAAGEVRYHYEAFFANGYEVKQKVTEQELNKLVAMTQKIATAEKIIPGKYTCLFTPELSGLLAHESFGHGMESDTIYKDRAKAKEFLGKPIAATFVNILDNPSFPSRNGSFFFDDEGFITSPTYLVKDGIVNLPITDSYSASRLKLPRSGNARAESYDHKLYARMSNTYFGPGKSKKEEMLKKIKNGFYLHYSSGGMEDPKSWGIQIQGIVAERISNGKLTGELFYEVGMTGYLPDLLKNIKEVSEEFEVPGTGTCGKGHKEWVRVSEGGPFMLVNEVNLS